MSYATIARVPAGKLAQEWAGVRLPLIVLKSTAGYYLGTANDAGPVSRESVEYWPSQKAADAALHGVEGRDWTQRTEL